MKYINKFKKTMLAGMAAGVASVLLSTGAFAQTTLTVIAANPQTGNNYQTLAAAVTYINGATVPAGGFIVNVASGHTESLTAALSITKTGTAANPIVIQKASGAAVTPVITAPTGAGATDAIISLKGVQYITWDGINIQEKAGNTNATEYGFYIINGGTGSNTASTNNNIKNSVVTLSRANTASIGVYQTATKASTLNSTNIYENITIQNVFSGIFLNGNGTETGNIIRKVTIGSTSANDIGNGNASTYGIQLTNQSGVTVEKSIIRNVTTTSTTGTAYGINFTNAAGSNLIRNNVIYNLNSANTTNNTTMGVVGMLIAGSAGSFDIDYNSVSIAPSTVTSSNAAIQFTSVASVNKLRNNILSNTTAAQSGAKHYAIVLPASSLGASGSLSNNNDLYVANTNGFVGRNNTTDATALSDWRTATSNDALSISQVPSFTSNSDLVLDATVTNNWYFNGTGVQVSTITSDLNNNTVPATVSAGAPDMGAYQFTPTATPPGLTMTGTIAAGNTNTFTFAGRTVASITWAAGSAVPTSLTMNYFPGSDLMGGQQSGNYQYFNSYWQVNATGTGPYNYSITLNYRDEEKGNITSTVQLAKTVNANETQWSIPASQSGTANSMTATGLTSFSRFTGTGSITPLPVNLTSFEAVRKGETAVALSWTTRGELNNDRFEIERSSNGVNFTTVGTVTGNGTTNNPINYQFEDLVNAATNPVLYYRLKQVDYNGASEYSEIKRVVSTVSVVDVKAWYNQSSEKIQVSNIKTVAEPVTITVYDMQGRVVAQQFEQFTKGNNTTEVNLQGLNNGIYTFMISSESGNKIQKIVKY